MTGRAGGQPHCLDAVLTWEDTVVLSGTSSAWYNHMYSYPCTHITYVYHIAIYVYIYTYICIRNIYIHICVFEYIYIYITEQVLRRPQVRFSGCHLEVFSLALSLSLSLSLSVCVCVCVCVCASLTMSPYLATHLPAIR